MFCKNCGNQIQPGEKFCSKCGNALDSNNNFVNNIEPVEEIKSEENLVKDFIGIKYDEISNQKFSFWTFLFGPFYFFYRKMYLYGVIYSLCELIAMINVLLGIGLHIGAGFLFKKIYLTHVTNKINKLKEQNSQLDYNEIIKICIRKGGTSFAFVAIYFAVIGGMALLLFILASLFMPVIMKSRIEKINANATASEVDSLSYIIPSGYQKDTSSSYDYYVKDDNCNFRITSFDLATDISEEEFIKNMLASYDDYELNNETINDLKWQIATRKINNDLSIDFYLKNYNNKMYILRYDVDKSQNNDCFYESRAVIQSLKLK